MAAVMLAGACVSDNLPGQEESSKVFEEDMAPTFTTTLLDGSTVSLEEYRGAPLLLILFDCGCPDCKNLLDDLHAAIKAGTPTPRVLAIGRDGDAAAVATYREEHGYTIDMAPDPDRAVYSLYATTYVPRAYLIDGNGKIVMMSIEYDTRYIPALLDRAQKL